MATKRNKLRAPNVYDRGSGWQVRIRRSDASGKLHLINRSFPYDAEAGGGQARSRAAVFALAATWAAKESAAFKFDGKPASSQIAGETLGGWLTRYAAEFSPPKKSYRSERSVVSVLTNRYAALCQRQPDALSSADFVGRTDSLVAWMTADEYSAGTIRKYLTLISHCFTMARDRWGFECPNPLRGAQRPRNNAPRDRVLTPDEWEAVMQHLDGADPATTAVLQFLRATACRRGEAIKLSWGDIDWTTKPPVALLRDTKSPKRDQPQSRSIPLNKDALDALQPMMFKRSPPKEGRVFVTAAGEPLRADSVTRAWIRAREKAGCPDATVHDIRHTRTTEIGQHLSIQETARLTGHSDPRTLMRYFHPTAADMGRKLEEAERTAKRSGGR
jgi:integrase